MFIFSYAYISIWNRQAKDHLNILFFAFGLIDDVFTGFCPSINNSYKSTLKSVILS